jgi:hypothetical protein
MRFLCLKTNSVLSLQRIKATRRHFFFNTPPENWTRKFCEAGKFRKIHDTPAPEDHPETDYDATGYEEIDGELYQTWVKR